MKGPTMAMIGLVYGVVLAQCEPDPYAAIAAAHAPVHYQDTNAASAIGDYLTAVDYDGDWSTIDNWDHLEDPASWATGGTGLGAVVYQSVVETCTHDFIVYAMYHPRDWSNGIGQEHENDMEGLVVAVRKDGTPNGHLEGVITHAHDDFYSYTPAGSTWTAGHNPVLSPTTTSTEDIDGTLTFQSVDGAQHFVTSQEAEGHGLKAYPYAGNFSGLKGQDGITYLPGTTADVPSSGDARNVRYLLVSLLDAAYPLQLSQIEGAYATWGRFDGDESGGCGDGWDITCIEDSARPPWAWDDLNDQMAPGMPALDPATLFLSYFDDVGAFSTSYVSNRYLEGLRDYGYSDAAPPAGFPGDMLGTVPFSLDEAYGRIDAICP